MDLKMLTTYRTIMVARYEPTTFNGTLDLLIWSGVLRLPDLEASDYWEPSRKRRTGLLGFVTERATWCK